MEGDHHHHHHKVSGKNLFITIIFNIIITLSQIIGGVLSGSLALLSDAIHNFSDVLALIIAYIAHQLASKPSTQNRTFGYKRAEIIAALFNASVLTGCSFSAILGRFCRFSHHCTLPYLGICWSGERVYNNPHAFYPSNHPIG